MNSLELSELNSNEFPPPEDLLPCLNFSSSQPAKYPRIADREGSFLCLLRNFKASYSNRPSSALAIAINNKLETDSSSANDANKNVYPSMFDSFHKR